MVLAATRHVQHRHPEQGGSGYHLKMNATRLRHLIAGGVLAASAIFAAPAAVAQPDNPVDPGNAGDVGTSAPPNNANDARCIAMPYWIPCQGGEYGQVPGAFD